MPFALRAATPEDADAIAGVLAASFRLLNFLPMLHTAEEDRRFIANVVLRDCAVTVAEDETHFLDPLFSIAGSGRTPAAELVEDYRTRWAGDVTRIYTEQAY